MVRRLFVFAPLAFLFLVFMGAGLAVAPPLVRTSNTPDAFDVNAAHARLVRILGDETPHPVDSDAQDLVRERLLQEIRALGYAPEVRDEFACRAQPRRWGADCARVRNIIFQAGPESGAAILAAAHYDSVPAAPGAADDGLGIAVLLEIARLVRDQPLARRIVFLISDGEEPGLLGAHAFAADPLMQSVEALVNVEARGTRGPVVFFESNQPNADAVAAFAGAPHGIANSVMADVYALLPNSTDVSALTRPGLDIVNLALLDGVENYHTPQDSLASLDRASLQHAGDLALHTLRVFASTADRREETAYVYTDIASRALVSAPLLFVKIALGLCVLIAAFAFWRSGAEGRWRALAAALAGLVIAGALAAGAGFALSALRPGEDYAFAYPEMSRAWCVLIALSATVAALMLTRGANPALVQAAAMLWFTLLGFVASFLLGGISMLFALPALVFALGCSAGLLWRPAQTIGSVLAAFVALAVWSPTLSLTELALGFEFPFATALLFALVLLTWFGLIAQAQRDASWRWPAAITGVAALACVIAAGLAPSATAARPQPLNVTYFLDTDANAALLLVGSAERPLPDAFGEGFNAELLLPGDTIATWTSETNAHPVPTARLEDIAVSAGEEGRIVRARIAAAGVGRVIIRVPRSAQPSALAVNGVSILVLGASDDDEFFSLICNGRACNGALIEIALAGETESDWLVIGQTPGFTTPESAALIARRPASRTAIQQGDGVLAVSRQRP